jgi:hypothetical protein
MKIMAIGSINPLTPEQRRQYMPKEVPDTLRLYLNGKIEQFWFHENAAGVIFLMNVDSVEQGVLSRVVFGEFSGGGLLLDSVDEDRPLDDLGQQRRTVQRSPTL